MNWLIELLNHWGGVFLHFSWPMLWQSSLLIVLVLAVDFLFRNKLRASLRYALWLVILIKLCLPPTLALPTSPAWWLQKNQTAAAQPTLKKYAVTYDNTPPVETPAIPLPASTTPKPAITFSGSAFALSFTTSTVLFIWLVVRWRQITRKVQIGSVSERLTAIATEAQKVAGIKCAVPVRLAINSMSPAVCGLFRPTILIPESMVSAFSDEQLHAVLLHELIHVRRFDVWVNFWQALLQIIYWWHPLVWLANSRLRRVREESVDDAVMLALRDDADSYAPTLLEVAKLSLDRATLSLGLVGILESRHSLRQRIERLLDFHPPRHAGLTLASVVGILAFTVVAVPMGDAPENKAAASNPAAATPPAPDEPTNSPALVIEAHFYWLGAADFQTVTAKKSEWAHIPQASGDSCWIASREQFSQLTEKLNISALKPFCSPRIETGNGIAAELFFGDKTNQVDLECIPSIKGLFVDLTIRGKNISSISGAATSNQFSVKIATAAQQGIVIQPKLSGDSGGSNLMMTISLQTIPDNTGSWLFEKRPAAAPSISNSPPVTGIMTGPNFQVTIHKLERSTGLETMPEPEVATSIRGQNRLNVANGNQNMSSLASAFDQPVSTNEYGLKFFNRVFKLDTNAFHIYLEKQNIAGSNSLIAAIKELAGKAGVDMDSPVGKLIFYNDRNGLLFIKAPQSDLDAIEQLILRIPRVPPQVHIKARFIEVPMKLAKSFESSLKMTNGSKKNSYGILSRQEFKAILHSLETKPGVETLAEPEVLTLSGRQTQMRVTSIINIVTGFTLDNHQTGTNSSLIPKTETVETGSVLDVFPYVMADDFTVNLRTIPTTTVFLGYDKSRRTTNLFAATGEKVKVPAFLPRFTIQQSEATANLWDGQTLVIGKFDQPTSDLANQEPVPTLIGTNKIFLSQPTATTPPAKDRQLLVFVSVDLADPTGNKIHSAEDMPFAQTTIPVQPDQKTQ